MKPIKYIVLILFLSSSIAMISQDTLGLNKHPKVFTKAVALPNPVMNTSGLNYPYKSNELPKTASLEDRVEHTSVFNYPKVSDGSNVIYIGMFNVPRGAVRVTAGDRQLQEGIDYTVNYQIGTVQIIDPSFAASKVPINIVVEKKTTPD